MTWLNENQVSSQPWMNRITGESGEPFSTYSRRTPVDSSMDLSCVAVMAGG